MKILEYLTEYLPLIASLGVIGYLFDYFMYRRKRIDSRQDFIKQKRIEVYEMLSEKVDVINTQWVQYLRVRLNSINYEKRAEKYIADTKNYMVESKNVKAWVIKELEELLLKNGDFKKNLTELEKKVNKKFNAIDSLNVDIEEYDFEEFKSSTNNMCDALMTAIDNKGLNLYGSDVVINAFNELQIEYGAVENSINRICTEYNVGNQMLPEDAFRVIVDGIYDKSKILTELMKEEL